MLVILPVGQLVITKRHIADGKVKKAVRQMGLFKACYGDIYIWIKLFCNPARDTVKLHAVELAVLHTVGEHTKKVAHTTGRL